LHLAIYTAPTVLYTNSCSVFGKQYEFHQRASNEVNKNCTFYTQKQRQRNLLLERGEDVRLSDDYVRICSVVQNVAHVDVICM